MVSVKHDMSETKVNSEMTVDTDKCKRKDFLLYKRATSTIECCRLYSLSITPIESAHSNQSVALPL